MGREAMMPFNPFQFIQFLRPSEMTPIDYTQAINAYSKGMFDVLNRRKEDLAAISEQEKLRDLYGVRQAAIHSGGDLGAFADMALPYDPRLALTAREMTMRLPQQQSERLLKFDDKILSLLEGVQDEAQWNALRDEIAQKTGMWIPDFSVGRAWLESLKSRQASAQTKPMSDAERKAYIDAAFARYLANRQDYANIYASMPDEVRQFLPIPGSADIERQFAALGARVKDVVELPAVETKAKKDTIENIALTQELQKKIGDLYVSPPEYLWPRVNSVVDSYQKEVQDLNSQLSQANTLKNILNRAEQTGGNVVSSDFIAAIYTFMKLLDPRSVVRESEFQTVGSLEGFVGALNNLGAKATGDGYILSREAVNRLRNTIDVLVKNANDLLTEKQLHYGSNLVRLGVMPTMITDDSRMIELILRKDMAERENQRKIVERVRR